MAKSIAYSPLVGDIYYIKYKTRYARRTCGVALTCTELKYCLFNVYEHKHKNIKDFHEKNFMKTSLVRTEGHFLRDDNKFEQ